MNLIFNTKRLIFQYLAPHRRQAVRLKWLYSLIDLQGVFDTFHAWRSHYRYKVKVTSQILVLTHHLNKVFNTNILIQSYVDSYVIIGNIAEETHWISLGLEDEQPGVFFPLTGESTSNFDDSDFLVIAPGGTDVIQLRGEIDKYNLADKKYNIKVS